MHEIIKTTVKLEAGRLCIGLLLIWMAARGWPFRSQNGHSPFAFDEYSWLDLAGVALGLLIVLLCTVRLVPELRKLMRAELTMNDRFFARAGLPRSIYELLLGIAAVDGYTGPDERAVIARLLLRQLPDKVLPQDLKNWSTKVEPPLDPVQVARSMVRLLRLEERARLVRWCHEIAAADDRADGDEHAVLAAVTAVLEGG